MRRTIANIILAFVCLVLTAPFPVSAETDDDRLILGPLPVPQEVTDIAGTTLVNQYLYSEAIVRGAAEPLFLLQVMNREVENLIEPLTRMGFDVRLGERQFPSTATATTGTGNGISFDEVDFTTFETEVRGMLDGIATPGMDAVTSAEAVAQAEAYRDRLIAKVDAWLEEYRQEINATEVLRPIDPDRYPEFTYTGASAIKVVITLPDFDADRAYLAGILESIPEADTVEAAWQTLNDYYEEAFQIRNTMLSRASEIENDINEAFTEWVAQFQQQLRTDLEAYAEYQSHLSRYKLLVEARTEALRAQAAIFDSIFQEIYEMHLAQYKGQDLTPEQVEQIMMEGFRLGMSRGATEGMKAQRELTTKYQQAAEDERGRITAMIEAQATEGEKQARYWLEFTGRVFTGLQDAANAALESPEYDDFLAPFVESATEYYRQIMETLLDYHLQDAIRLIESNRSSIDLAFNEGRIDTNTDGLLARLSEERNDILEELLGAGNDPASIAAIQSRFQSVWEEIRQNLEKTRYEGIDAILARMSEQIPDNLDELIDTAISQCGDGINRLETMADNRWQEYENHQGEGQPKGLFYDCWLASFSPRHDEYFPPLKTAATTYITQLEKLSELLAEYRSVQSSPNDHTIEQLLDLKDEFISAYNNLKRYEQAYQWAFRDYENVRQQTLDHCLNQTEGSD